MQKFTCKTLEEFDHRSVNDEPYCLTDEEGNIFYLENHELHRLDEPAAIYVDGSFEWWYRGDLHRNDGPAFINEEENIIEFWHKGYQIDCNNLEDFKVHVKMYKNIDLVAFK